jgi:hypothetical protein
MHLDRSPALVVNEAFARLYGRGKGVAGQSIDGPFGGSFGASRARRGEIVGVVGDTRYDLREDAAPMVYLPVRARAMIVARTSASTEATERQLRNEIQAASPLLRVTGMTPLSTTIEDTLVRERLLALLSGFFAATGLLLAGVGLYGVLSYSVV